MWGQGNSYDKKFVNLVCDWLTSRDQTAQPIWTAHSGAIAALVDRDKSAPELWGEVPEASPSVFAQSMSVDPRSVDIVLVNGGINDVSALQVVVANPFDPNGIQKLTHRTDDVFTGPVATLIKSVVARFSSAKIVV